MPSRHKQRKARKRTERMIEEAWDALAAGDHVLAAKISRRAFEAGAMNPRICDEHGQIMRSVGETGEAEEAFRTAVRIAPTFAPAFANLAALQASLGKWLPAARLQEKAVELQPDDAAAAELLARYRGAAAAAVDAARRAAGVEEPAAAGREPTEPRDEDSAEPVAASADSSATSTSLLAAIDWEGVAAVLVTKGLAVLPQVLEDSVRTALIALRANPIAASRDLGRDDAGGRFGAFALHAPLPAAVQDLRASLFPHARAIVRSWATLLQQPDRPPADLQAVLAQRAPAGVSRGEGVVLLELPAGGFRVGERIAWREAFPLQAWVDLGPHRGLEVTLVDRRPGRRQKGSTVRTRPGDVVLTCVRDRLDVVGGVYGLQPVATTLRQSAAATTFVLGLPFHDHDAF